MQNIVKKLSYPIQIAKNERSERGDSRALGMGADTANLLRRVSGEGKPSPYSTKEKRLPIRKSFL